MSRWRAFVGTLLVVSLCSTACVIPSDPTVATRSPAPQRIDRFDDKFAAKLRQTRPMAQVKKMPFKGTEYNVSKPLHRFGGGQDIGASKPLKGAWVTYLAGLNDGRIAEGRPRQIEAIAHLTTGTSPNLTDVCEGPRKTVR